MGWPSRVRASILRITVASLVLSVAAACSGASSDSGAVGTTGAEQPFALEVRQAYITVENRTGTTLVGGQLEIVQGGTRPPFRSKLPRIEVGGKRDIALNTFTAFDGSVFSRGITRTRSLVITAQDLGGKEYEQEFPFR